MDHSSKQPVPSTHSHGNAPLQMAGFSREPQDTRDFNRVILGGGYAGVSAPANPPIAQRS
jgi:hypothetical protein